jgi:predicted transcriptional regulator
MSDDGANNVVDLASNLTVAWLGNPNTRATAEEATGFLDSIHAKLSSLTGGGAGGAAAAAGSATSGSSATTPEPAVTVRKSLASKDHIISLIDGKPYTTLKRHLGAHGLTPAQYRERYGLKSDYPMVAPAYAEKRRELAKKIGLGRKPGSGRKPAAPKPAATKASAAKAAAKPTGAPATPRRRGRPPKAK